MALPTAEPPERIAYRRIPHGLWRRHRTGPKPDAFIPREGFRLSFFRADLQTPRGVLQHQLDLWAEMLGSEDELLRHRAERALERHGRTVEELIANQWGVVRVPLMALVERGFSLEQPDAAGHFNVEGDYELHAVPLSQLAVEVAV